MIARALLGMLLFVTTAAKAEDLSRFQRNELLKQGAFAMAGSVAMSGVLAGLGAMLTAKRCWNSTDDDGNPTTWCGTGDGARYGAAIGAVLGYELMGWTSISTAFLDHGRKLGLRGHARMTRSAAFAASAGALTLTIWSVTQLQDRGPALTVPIGIAGTLATVVAPWGFGYLAYRGSHRRKRGPVVTPMVAPTMIGMRGRF